VPKSAEKAADDTDLTRTACQESSTGCRKWRKRGGRLASAGRAAEPARPCTNRRGVRSRGRAGERHSRLIGTCQERATKFQHGLDRAHRAIARRDHEVRYICAPQARWHAVGFGRRLLIASRLFFCCRGVVEVEFLANENFFFFFFFRGGAGGGPGCYGQVQEAPSGYARKVRSGVFAFNGIIACWFVVAYVLRA